MGQHEHGRLNKPFRANGQHGMPNTLSGCAWAAWSARGPAWHDTVTNRALNRFGRIVPGLGRPFGQRYAHVPIS